MPNENFTEDDLPQNPAPKKVNNDASQARQEDVMFQIMPNEGQVMNNNNPEQPSSDVAASMHAESEPHPFKNKLVYTIIGILVIAIAAAAAYFLLGSKADDNAVVTQIPKTWLKTYFNVDTCTDLTTCGDTADPDNDGFTNYEEFKVRKGTDPHNPDSDGDGLADGDEAHIFKTEPAVKFSSCIDNTGIACQYDDGSQISNDYDPLTPGIKMTDTRKQQIASDTETFKLHAPTATSLDAKRTSQTTNAPAAQTYTVSIQNGKFNPSSVTLKAGDSIVWINKDTAKHEVASNPHPSHTDLEGLVSPALDINLTYTFAFTTKGTFGYHDEMNPSVEGIVVVQ